MIKEVILVFSLILGAIWASEAYSSLSWLCALSAAAIMIWSFRFRGDSGYNLGFCPISVAKPALYLLGLTVIMAVVIIVIGFWINPNVADQKDFWVKIHGKALGTYVLWGAVQQFLLNGYFTNRIGGLMKGFIRPAMVSGLLFAIVHLPNPVLMIGTFIWGTASAYFFLRYSRNIYLLGFAHSILGTLTKYFIALPLITHGAMRVGPGFWN